MKHFITVSDFDRDEIDHLLNRADYLQEKWITNQMPQSLKDKKIALWFFGQGFRNRMAFEIGARSMGADVSFIPGELGVHEPIEDIAQYLNNWFSMLVIRCKSHEDLKRVVDDSKVPVINARTAHNHPCEIVGDLQYIRMKRKTLEGLNVVFIGEVTNLCMSWFEAAKVLPIHVLQIGPEKYLLPQDTVDSINQSSVGTIGVSEEIEGNITKDTDVLYTDCWPHDGKKEVIRQLFEPYQITRNLVDKMNTDGFFLPCPPVTRGEEISADSLNSERFCDYQAKEYLLHSQNAIMEYCMNEKWTYG